MLSYDSTKCVCKSPYPAEIVRSLNYDDHYTAALTYLPKFHKEDIFFDVKLSFSFPVGVIFHVTGDSECRKYHVICKKGLKHMWHRVQRLDCQPPDFYDGLLFSEGAILSRDGIFHQKK